MMRPLKLLVVDDDRDMAEGLTDVLEFAGHEVRLALTVDEASKILRKENFDYAFINVKQPGKSTLESFVKVRQINRSTRSVMMTGFSIEQLLTQAGEDRAVTMLHTPVVMETLLKTLEGGLTKGMILVAEDDEGFWDSAGDVLTERSYETFVTRSPREGMEKALGGGLDILVLDYRLALMDALEIYLVLKKRIEALPALVIRGFVERKSGQNEILRDLRATGILFKPFDPPKLLAAIDQIFESRPATAPAGQSGAAGQAAPANAPFESDAAGADGPAEAAQAHAETVEQADVAQSQAVPSGMTPDEDATDDQPQTSEQEDLSPDRADCESETGRGRVLVIDDNRDVAEGMADFLQAGGYDVEFARTADSAEQIAKRFDVQIALIDIRLGQTNGLELIAALKRHRPKLIAVIISAQTDQASAISALRKGAFDFLNKPVYPEEVFSAVERAFEKLNSQEKPKTKDKAREPVKLDHVVDSEFLANMSHDLRDRLNAVIGFSEILKVEMLGPLGREEYVDYAKDIHEAGQSLQEIIGDILDEAKRSTGHADSDDPEEIEDGEVSEDEAEESPVPSFFRR